MAARAIKSDRPYAAALVTAILLVVLVGFSRSFFLMPLFRVEPVSVLDLQIDSRRRHERARP